MAPRCAARDLDGVAVKITPYSTDARAKLRREILDADALHDVPLAQIVLKAIEAEAAGSELAALAERTSPLAPQLPPVLNQRLLALHTHSTLRCDVPCACLQQP
jgi:hypothetical protein